MSGLVPEDIEPTTIRQILRPVSATPAKRDEAGKVDDKVSGVTRHLKPIGLP